MPQSVDLDPEDWNTFREMSHRALDSMIDYLRDLRSQTALRCPSAETLARFDRDLPLDGRDFSDVIDDFDRYIKPFGDDAPNSLFMGAAECAGTPFGMVAEMLAAGMNSNCGGRNHIAIYVEQQIACWMAHIFNFPSDSSGIFVTSSMTNFYSLLVARHQTYGLNNVRLNGLNSIDSQLVAYASVETHDGVRLAMELSGLGAKHLRLIPSDEKRMMKLKDLRAMIAADREEGFKPFLVVGTAGTVDTGAIDPLDELADIAQIEDLWFHVDGTYGALVALSPQLKPLVKGLERANSVALDFDKWLKVPGDTGFFLVRDPKAQRRTFAANAAYLTRAPRGLAGREAWPCDFGADLSRGFRALKIWMTIEIHGAKKLGQCIEQTCQMAVRLEDYINKSEHFFIRAPVVLNIACFSVRGDDDGSVVRKIVMDLHERGETAASLTIMDCQPVIRAVILNHRIQNEDIDRLILRLDEALWRVCKKSIIEDKAQHIAV